MKTMALLCPFLPLSLKGVVWREAAASEELVGLFLIELILFSNPDY